MLSRQRIGFVLIAAPLLALPTTLFAAQDRLKREYPVKTFAVEETEAEVGIEYQYFGQKIERRGEGRIRYSNNYFQEYYEGKARGYVYHPRFISYATRLKLGLAQQRLSRTGPGVDSYVSEDDRLLGYDLRLDFFKEHPVSGTVTARKDERILMGLFVDRYLVRTESYGGTVRWSNKVVPMDLSYTHNDIEEFGADSHSTTRSDIIEYNAHNNIRDRIRTDLQYRMQSYDRRFTANTFSGDVDRESELDSQDFQLTNRINLDAKRRSFLRSLFRYHEQENNTDLKTYFWQERLQWQHSEALRSYVTGSFQRSDYPDRTVDTYRGEAGLDHDLFQSLKSHFDVHGRHTDYGQMDEDRYGVTGRLSYRKTTALGTLTAGYARTLDRVERSGEAGTEEILDEEITLRASDPVFLDQQDVIESSIVVTDRDNEVVYTENFDYEVVNQGGRVGLRLLPGGLLDEGDDVLVDYRVDAESDLKYLADDQDAYVRHDFDRYLRGLSLYAHRHDSWAHNIESSRDAEIMEYTDQTAGLRQQWRDFAFTSEYQDFSSDSGGFEQWRNQLEGSHHLGSDINWGWNAGINQTRYDEDDEDGSDSSRYLFAGTHVDGRIARKGFWKLEARTMNESGRTDRTINGIIARVGYNWRRLTMEAGARFEQYNVEETDRDRVQLFVSLKRSLGRQPKSRASR
jgi:hypothetical protein